MKKTYCCSKREEKAMFVEGNLICAPHGNVFLVTDELTVVCVYSGELNNIGMSLNVDELADDYKVYHGSVTMEN